MNEEIAKKEIYRIIDEYIDDQEIKTQLELLFPHGVKSLVYEIDKWKNKDFAENDQSILKKIFIYYV